MALSAASTLVQGGPADEPARRRAARRNEAAERLRRELREIETALTLLLKLNKEEHRRRRENDVTGMILATVIFARIFAAMACYYMSIISPILHSGPALSQSAVDGFVEFLLL
jgi:hypothetical protein